MYNILPWVQFHVAQGINVLFGWHCQCEYNCDVQRSLWNELLDPYLQSRKVALVELTHPCFPADRLIQTETQFLWNFLTPWLLEDYASWYATHDIDEYLLKGSTESISKALLQNNFTYIRTKMRRAQSNESIHLLGNEISPEGVYHEGAWVKWKFIARTKSVGVRC